MTTGMKHTDSTVQALWTEIEQLRIDLAEERRQHQLTAQVSWEWKKQIDELRGQLGLPDQSKRVPFPPVTKVTALPADVRR